MDEGMLNIHKRLGVVEKNSHPPIFDKEQLNKINRRLENLETKSFVDKISSYTFEGSD